MIGFIRRRVSYANVALTAALVFAMAGGAFAATGGKHANRQSHHDPHKAGRKHKSQHTNRKGYVISSVKQIKPNVRKQLQGERGEAGEAGAPGATGSSVSATALPAGNSHCASGGSQFAAGGAITYACNGAAGAPGATGATGATGAKGEPGSPGEQGPQGEPGEPWVPNDTLPEGATETGAWFYIPTAAGEVHWAPISFPVRLAAELDSEHVKIVKVGEGEGEATEGTAILEKYCSGTAADPGAAPGYLCIFEGYSEDVLTKAEEEEGKLPQLPKAALIDSPMRALNGKSRTAEGAGTTGAILGFFVSKLQGVQEASGSWAVTGS